MHILFFQIVEALTSKSLAFLAGIRKNDIILAVNNIPLISGSQAAKLFTSSSYSPYSSPSSSKKSQSSQELCIRIKRLIFTDHKRVSRTQMALVYHKCTMIAYFLDSYKIAISYKCYQLYKELNMIISISNKIWGIKRLQKKKYFYIGISL